LQHQNSSGYLVLSEKEPSVFALAPLGEYFRTGARGDLQTLAIFEVEIIYGPFGAMYYTVKTSESAFEHLQGESMFPHLTHHSKRWAEHILGTIQRAVVKLSPTCRTVETGCGEKSERGAEGTLLNTN
jgi:hypothetical protein